ncbi:MAG: ribonuclease E/G [Lachnospiraceae bacterium]|nr:ribonuclease E/G [Lachnospiraceae bacterium]
MNDLQIILTTKDRETICLALSDDIPVYLMHVPDNQSALIEIGRVENVVRNLNAAFVKTSQNKIGYLPEEEVPKGALLNRSFDREDTIRNGDLLVVQKRANARGASKQPKLTGYLTLHTGRVVLGAYKKGVGSSAALPQEVRSILVRTCKEVITQNPALPADFLHRYGIILRTECGALYERALHEKESAEEAAQSVIDTVKEDILHLYEQMSAIQKKAETREAGTILYRTDPDDGVNVCFLNAYHFLQRAYPSTPVRAVCATEALAEMITSVAGENEDLTIVVNREADALYGVDRHLKKILPYRQSQKIWLKSGACLVMEQTEAMCVFDVNSGKYISKKDDDFVRVNLEAAKEVMRQIRIKDVTGIIIVDFINMRKGASVTELKELLRELCAQDPVYTRFIDITALGLAEITRTMHG